MQFNYFVYLGPSQSSSHVVNNRSEVQASTSTNQKQNACLLPRVKLPHDMFFVKLLGCDEASYFYIRQEDKYSCVSTDLITFLVLRVMYLWKSMFNLQIHL